MTALQTLINKWETEMSSYIPNAPIYKAFIEEAKQYLELEKQQIIDAYFQGSDDCDVYVNTNLTMAEEYFNETFNKQ